jgi:hypothetical protein
MDLSVTLRSGRSTKVTALGKAERKYTYVSLYPVLIFLIVANRVGKRDLREARLLKAALLAERNSVAAPPEDPGFVHSMIPPPSELRLLRLITRH